MEISYTFMKSNSTMIMSTPVNLVDIGAQNMS
jgi:hypothetical protein